MKTKLFFLSMVLFVLFNSCSKSSSNNTAGNGSSSTASGYVKINNDIYYLNKACYYVNILDEYTSISIASPELTINNLNDWFVGKNGTLLTLDISDLSSTLKPTSYYTPEFDACITIGYTATSTSNITGIDYDVDKSKPGSFKISKSGSTYTIQFDYTLIGGNKISGVYTGSVVKM